MGDKPFVLSDRSLDRLLTTEDRVDALPPRRDGQRQGPRGPGAAPLNWIKVTSTTAQTVNLPNSHTIQAYPAVWSYFDSGLGQWVDGTAPQNSVWYLDANGSPVASAQRYLARCVGADLNGQTIWSMSAAAGDEDVLITIRSATSSTVTTSVGTFTSYPALSYVPGGTGQNGWCVYPNGVPIGVPTASPILARQIATETSSGKPVWEISFWPTIHTDVTPSTLTGYVGQPYAAFTPAGNGFTNPSFMTTSSVIVGSNFIEVAGGDVLIGAGPSSTQYAGGLYLGASGPDGVGSVFVNGVCVAVGNGPDDGSYW